jgi:hypothetical protein
MKDQQFHLVKDHNSLECPLCPCLAAREEGPGTSLR